MEDVRKRFSKLAALADDRIDLAKAALLIIYRSPFPVEQIQMDPVEPANQRRLFSGNGGDYLIDRINMPIRIGESERKILRRIDGKQKLKSILVKIKGTTSENLIYFLMHLMQGGLVRI